MNVRNFAILGAIVAGLFFFGVLSPGKLKQFQCRSKQSEAKGNLKEARGRIQTSIAKGNRVPSTFQDLAWEPKAAKRYEYSINPGPGSSYQVEARALTDEMNGDVWVIDDAGTLTNKVDGCAHPR